MAGHEDLFALAPGAFARSCSAVEGVLPNSSTQRPDRPIVEAFAQQTPLPGVSGAGVYQRAIMLLSVHQAVVTG